jgi:uncharacterized membrane protein
MASAKSRNTEVSPLITTVGIVVIGGVFIEAAIIPGMLLGCSAFLAPKALKTLLRTSGPANKRYKKIVTTSAKAIAAPEFIAHIIKPSRSITKAFTFRVVSTSLDFGWNYAILGDIGVAAGLSSVSLVVAPIFYLVHETAWNIHRAQNLMSERVDHHISLTPSSVRSMRGPRLITASINSKVYKTITYRIFATLSEFGTNYVFARNVPQALSLTAFSAIIGPFIYYGHEIMWEYIEPEIRADTSKSKQLSKKYVDD